MAVQCDHPKNHIKTPYGHEANSSDTELQEAFVINSHPQSVFRVPNSPLSYIADEQTFLSIAQPSQL